MPRMQTRRSLATTAHQRRRYALWALAMLQWIAGFLFQAAHPTRRHLRQRGETSIRRLTHMVVSLIIIRAAELSGRRLRTPRYWRRGRHLRRRHIIRSLLGSRLRRALKPRTLAMRIHALIHALRHLDAFARQLSRRRLTRLWSIAPAPTPSDFVFDVHAHPPIAADSS